MEKEQFKGEGVWYFILSILFLILVWVLSIRINNYGMHLYDNGTFAFLLFALATLRLTRLFVYDRMTFFVRNYFALGSGAFRQSISRLLNCPWCTGVWAALGLLILLSFTSGFAQVLIFLLAAAGAASFLQVGANLIGWHAEHAKLTTQKLQRTSRFQGRRPQQQRKNQPR